MRRLSRFATLALASALYVFPAIGALAQPIPCTDGMAGEYACTDMDLYARIPVDEFGATAGNDIWGWTDPESGKEYALMGLRESTGFVDITDPANPQILGILMTATDPSVWRDIKVYDNHAFIVSEAPNHGMQVFDLTRLRGLDPDATREFEPETVFIGTDEKPLGSVHNIVMNEDSGYAYAVGAQECAGGLYAINVQDPTNPVYEGCFDEDGYTHDAQCVIYEGPDADYHGREICVNSNEDTITVVDITDKSNPVMLGKGEYPSPGYTHQGWFTEDMRYFIADDELDEIQGFVSNTRSMIFDLVDLDSPELIGIYNSENTSADHNMYTVGNRMYQANYTSGLRVLDLSNVADGELSEVAAFDIYPETDAAQFNGAWSVYPFFESGTVVISGVEGGLFVVRPSNTTSLNLNDFEATSNGESAYVTWAPSGSVSAPYTVQRSHEGGPFETVAHVDGNGPFSASFDVLSPGRHEFRLVQYFGGQIRISDATGVNVAAPSNYRLSDSMVDSDTNTGKVALTVAESQSVRISLSDSDGNHFKTIFEGEIESGIAHMFEVEGPGLPSGGYALNVSGETFNSSREINR